MGRGIVSHMRALPDDNLRYPVLIQLPNGSSGSGFFLRSDKEVTYFITARLVIFKVNAEGVFELCAERANLLFYDNSLKGEPMVLSVPLTSQNVKHDQSSDVAIVRIARRSEIPGKEHLTQYESGVQGLQPEKGYVVVSHGALRRFDDVLISNDVFILGYPNSLSNPQRPQIDYARPLLRKGIIAGKNEKNRTIILDCPVYFGNSGGLAIEVEDVPGGRHFRIIGVVSEYVPFIEQMRSLQMGYTNTNFENSGYSVVVPIDTIEELIGTMEENKL